MLRWYCFHSCKSHAALSIRAEAARLLPQREKLIEWVLNWQSLELPEPGVFRQIPRAFLADHGPQPRAIVHRAIQPRDVSVEALRSQQDHTPHGADPPPRGVRVGCLTDRAHATAIDTRNYLPVSRKRTTSDLVFLRMMARRLPSGDQ